MKDEDVSNIDQKAIQPTETEQLQNNPEFRVWQGRAKAVVGVLKVIEKLCMFGDQDEADDGFESDEDQNVMGDGAVVDLDRLKQFGWNILTSGSRPLLKTALDCATTIPLFMNLPQPTYEVFSDL